MKVHRDLPLDNKHKNPCRSCDWEGGGHTQHILYYDLSLFVLVVVRKLQYMYLYIHVYILHYIYQPPANAAGLSWPWRLQAAWPEAPPKQQQHQQQQQQHHSLHCQQHGEKHHQKATATTTTTTATTTTTTATTTTTTTRRRRRRTTRTKTRTTATATATRAAAAAAATAGSQQEQQHPQRTQGESSPRPFGCGVVVVVLVLVVLVVVVVGGGGLFLDEAKARPKDIISFSLDYNKQKLSTDKQSVIKPHFTRHAGRPADSVTTWQEPTTPLRGFHWLYVVYMTHPFPQEKSSEWRYALHLYSTPRLLGGWMMWPDINRWV